MCICAPALFSCQRAPKGQCEACSPPFRLGVRMASRSALRRRAFAPTSIGRHGFLDRQGELLDDVPNAGDIAIAHVLAHLRGEIRRVRSAIQEGR